METSYNGWTASANPAEFGGLTKLIVAGEEFAPGVRAGDVHTVLEYVAQQFHARVEPLIFKSWHEADDWGYNYRTNRNANNLSCHASGTAIDCNATRHPNGKAGTFTKAQDIEIVRILSEVENVVRWGGLFVDTKDEMHFEISGTPTAVKRVAERLRARRAKVEADVALSPEDIDKVAKRVWEIAIKNGFGDLVGPSQILNGIEVRLKDVQDKLNGGTK